MKKKSFIIGGVVTGLIIISLCVLVIYNFNKIDKLNNKVDKYESENKSLILKEKELNDTLKKYEDEEINNMLDDRIERTCIYTETYEFVDYYEKNGELIILVDNTKVLSKNDPKLLRLDTTKFKRDFIKNQSYEITFEKTILYTQEKNRLEERIVVTNIKPIDSDEVGIERVNEFCIFE